MFKKFFIGIISALAIGACGNQSKNNTSEIKSQEIAFTKEGNLQLFNGQGTLITSLDIEIADNDYETETGLMHRTAMKKNRGMLFIFKDEQPRYFYMKNTEFSLDIIYLNAQQKVVSFIENAEPFNENSLPSEEPAKYVLEINSGLIKEWGIQKGDSITFNRVN